MDLAIIGTVAFDDLMAPSGRRERLLGGSATYSSLAASFFTRTDLISVVGTDFPERYLDLFRNRRINLDGLETKKGKTFRWKARYTPDLSAAVTLKTDLNVFADFKPVIPRSVRMRGGNLLLANIDPELQGRIFRQWGGGGIVACDTMNLWISEKRRSLLSLLKNVDLFFLNDAEATQLSGEENLLSAARYISSKGAKMTVIKKGEHGALFFSRDKHLVFIVPAYLLEIVKDPTGAGDAFAGGVMGYLSRRKRVTGADLRKALVYGSIAASFTVEEFGPDGLLKTTRADIQRRFRHFRQLTRF